MCNNNSNTTNETLRGIRDVNGTIFFIKLLVDPAFRLSFRTISSKRFRCLARESINHTAIISYL